MGTNHWVAGKINHGHVGAAQLGTCDEAGGAPTTPQFVKFARANEAASERVRDMARTQDGHRLTVPVFSAAIAAIGMTLGLGIWMTP
jgi:hypothetical protein